MMILINSAKFAAWYGTGEHPVHKIVQDIKNKRVAKDVARLSKKYRNGYDMGIPDTKGVIVVTPGGIVRYISSPDHNIRERWWVIEK